MPTELHIRLVTDPQDPAFPAFGRLQERTFPEPDLLIPAIYLPRMIASRTPQRRNYMLVAERAGQLVGGTIFHYFPGPNTGFSSFLTVAPEQRGLGVARRLHEARLAHLDREAGERAPVHGLFIDVSAPERLSPDEIARELALGLDPADRRRAFHRLGFRKVAVAYYQPPDGPGEEPITTMDLLFCPRDPGAAAIPTEWVVQTMHAYWTPWLGREAADTHSAELRRRCGGETVALLSPI